MSVLLNPQKKYQMNEWKKMQKWLLNSDLGWSGLTRRDRLLLFWGGAATRWAHLQFENVKKGIHHIHTSLLYTL